MNTKTIVLLGSSGVGKTCLILRLLTERFEKRHHPTIQERVTFYPESPESPESPEHKALELTIIDAGDVEHYDYLVQTWMHLGDVFVLMYSCTDAGSLSTVSDLAELLHEERPEAPFMLCSTKSDLQEANGHKLTILGQLLAQRWGVPFMQTSSKTGESVKLCIQKCLDLEKTEKSDQDSVRVSRVSRLSRMCSLQ